MGVFFSKAKRSRVSEHDKAVLQVKQQRDKLKQYQQKVEKQLETERQLAKKLLNEGKRDRAKLLLRKKKLGEQLLSKADAQLENLETIINDLEFAQAEKEVIKGLQLGNEALKQVNTLYSIEDVERIMDETRESIEKQREIDEMLQGVLTNEDEADVEVEFEKMMADSRVAEPEPKVPIAEPEEFVSLPEVPSEEPSSPEEASEEAEKTKPSPDKEKVKSKEKVAVLAE
uniref:Charged multivesicular body protein 6 n=1 Tax=Cacopsylla melanoneura TaxID=428564 RepID=A0A8D8XZY4_9HEMI